MSWKSMIATMAILLALAAPREVVAQNGILEFEMPFNHIEPHIECLGEGIEINFTVTVRTHLIELQNGGFHYVENWFGEGTAVGLDSGLTWFAVAAPAPYRANSNGSQLSESWVVAVNWKPLDGGRKLRERWPVRFIYDANGVPHIEQFEPREFTCIGGPN